MYVPHDLGIEAADLGARESVPPSTAPAEALHTFTLDLGGSRYFFRDSTTLTPLSTPIPVRQADPSGGPVLARSSTVLPCPAVPSGSLSGLHLPSFSTNLVRYRCPPGRNGHYHHSWGSGSTPLLVPPPIAPDSPVAPPPRSRLPATPSWHALPPPYLWSSQDSILGTHAMALRPSFVPLRVPLLPPLASILPALPDPESDRAHAASPTISRLLATVVTDPSFKSTAASALIDEVVDFAAACRLDYASALVAKSESASPPSVEGECALGTDVLEDWQEDFECLAAVVPRFASMLLASEGYPDAPDIPTPRSYAEAITGPYSSQWQAAMDAEMASWKSTGTYVDAAPPSRANIVNGMWIFRRDYELHSLGFSTAFLQGSLHEEIWLRRPPGFTGTTLAALGFTPSTADLSMFLRTDTSLPPFYVFVYVEDLVFATADTEELTLITRDRAQRTISLTQSHMVHQVLQRFGFQFSSPQPTPHSTGHLLSAPPSNESVEPSGPYPELVGCLMYLMTCTRPDLAYPLSLLARYVALGRHRKVHWDAAKRVLCYLCSTSGMGLVLGGRGPVVLTGHANASWVDDSATQRSSQGYTC
ncbi:unnamed protein product [Closterium sp. NIES-53]